MKSQIMPLPDASLICIWGKVLMIYFRLNFTWNQHFVYFSRAEESVERTYEPADIARYISFARLFKPKVTEESMEHLVDQYKHLRQRDTGGGFKSSWRITVRQLESMIRLSEAMARMACNDKVELKHVQEAYRLLNKSIIRVVRFWKNLWYWFLREIWVYF